MSFGKVHLKTATTTTTQTTDVWHRPSDRPTNYVIADNNNEVVTINNNEVWWLFGVQDNSPNDFAVLADTSAGNYNITYGVGLANEVTTSYTKNTLAQYQFVSSNWADAPVDSRGYKMVWIRLTPTAGNDITVINIDKRPTWRPSASSTSIYASQVLEFYIKASALTTLTFAASYSTVYNRYSNCDIFSLENNNITTSFPVFLSDFHNLKKIYNLDISKSSAINYFMYNCRSYNQPFPSGVTFANATTYFMNGCPSYNRPFSSGVTFAGATTYFMVNCASYNQPFPSGVTFANVTTNFMQFCTSYNQPFPSGVTFANATTNFMTGCSSYNQPFPSGVTFANATTQFMNSCYAYNQPFPSGVTFANATTQFMNICTCYNQPLILLSKVGLSDIGAAAFNAMYALKSLRLPNWNTNTPSITISNSSLDTTALVALFNDAPDRTATTTGTVTITGCYGASTLTAGDRAILTNKNYTIVG